ncbi:DUF1559 family PulG-like putative transporter [Aquisphaera insulae]|uniref:DUF1559 family PulG-like putative transporter n=1 Tax=Aquisphaera insulae TaxID=2712864 RepID=UPI0013ED9DFA|nr:DUF1559 domain-containing protein [Aquisphaera insulae]
MSRTVDHDPEFAGAVPKPAGGARFGCIEGLVCLGLILLLAALLLPATRSARGAARRAQCVTNLKQIALALRNYADAEGAFPPACTFDADGRRLHSWRTLIWPYLNDHDAFYATVDLSKPWDDPVNRKAAENMPSTYRCPSSKAPRNTTAYLASAGPSAFLDPEKPRRLAEITDGTDATLAVIEADEGHAVPWMAPIDADETTILSITPDSTLVHPVGVNAAFGDGSVKFLKATVSRQALRGLISIAGKDDPSSDAY